MAGRGLGLPDDQRYELLMTIPNPSPHVDELVQAKREIELLKGAVRVYASRIYAFRMLKQGLRTRSML
jgi:hypothetical protein